MNRHRSIPMTVILLILLALTLPALAGGGKKIREDWLANDLAMISDTLGGLSRIGENRPITEADLTYLGLPCRTDKDLGFGGRRLFHQRPGGYTYFQADVLLFESEVAVLELEVDDGSPDSWNQISGRIREAWAAHGGPPCELAQYGLVHRIEFPERHEAFRAAVAGALGPLAEVRVPEKYAEEYKSLLSPMTGHTIGLVCGFGGSQPAGSRCIERLAKKGQWPLVVNILRGYNPEGRVYAALALLRAERHGREIAPDIRATIDTVLGLDLLLSKCDGCIVSRGVAARIVEIYLDDLDQQWDRF